MLENAELLVTAAVVETLVLAHDDLRILSQFGWR